jgi:hypothetical protein
MTASARTIRRTCRRLIPTARSMPSSRVRSNDRERERIDDAEQSDDHRQREQREHEPEQLVDLVGLVLLELVQGQRLGDREGGQRLLGLPRERLRIARAATRTSASSGWFQSRVMLALVTRMFPSAPAWFL